MWAMVEAHKVYNHRGIEGMVLKPKMLATAAELLVIPAYLCLHPGWLMSVVGMITSSQVLKSQVDNYLAMDLLGVYTDDCVTCKPNAVTWAKWTILFVSNFFYRCATITVFLVMWTCDTFSSWGWSFTTSDCLYEIVNGRPWPRVVNGNASGVLDIDSPKLLYGWSPYGWSPLWLQIKIL
jgi:hypothetical protein